MQQNVVVSKQYIGGSLFKSQNGTILLKPIQDLTFKLQSIICNQEQHHSITPIEAGNLRLKYYLKSNSTLPRKLTIDGVGTRTNDLPIGIK